MLLHIIATPRLSESNTLRISYPFLDCLQAKHPNMTIETLDLFSEDLPAVAGENIEAKYSLMVGQPIDRRHAESWKEVEVLIERFLAADIYLISAPMWNFNIPYALKYFIDAIVQPHYLFEYNEQGVPVGLCQGKKMVCITTRGADYSAGNPLHPFDLQESYLRSIFGFVGITDMQFINAQPMDGTLEMRDAAIAAGIEEASVLAENLEW